MAKIHTTAALYGENAAVGDVKGFPTPVVKQSDEYYIPQRLSSTPRWNINERGLKNFAYLCGLVA